MSLITTCDPIDPYTATGTFGVSYNGGYKPDKTLQWIPPDTNVIDERDDFLPPPLMPPPNMLMQTCEGRRIDPRVGGIPKRDIQYDDFTDSVPILQAEPPKSKEGKLPSLKGGAPDLDPNLLIVLTLLLLILLFVTRFS